MSTRESRLKGALETSIPMLVVGAGNLITQANAAAHRLLGYSHGALRGMTVDQLAPDTERAAMALMRAAGENATHLRIRSRAMRADGRVIDVCLMIEPCVHNTQQAVDVFVSYKPLAPWEAQRMDEGDGEPGDSVPPLERLAG